MSHEIVYVALQQFCESDERPLRMLEQTGFVVERNSLGRRLRREEMIGILRNADAVLAGVEPYDTSTLAALPNLRCISRCGVGTDAIDLGAAAQRGITVYTTIEEVVEPVAQMTLAFILALARNIPLHAADCRDGLWKKHTGVLLSEWTIGLVGFGRVGRAVERYLRALQPHVLVTDPALKQSDVPEKAELCDLTTLLRRSDLVSLHASGRPTAEPLLGRAELGLMKRGSYVVNTARGFLIDELALSDALVSGHLAGAALDVFEEEPYTGSLAKLPHVLCTPHISTLTRASRAAMEYRCALNVVKHFQQRTAIPVTIGAARLR